MKALTLAQPHASLVALGVQSILTTTWRPSVDVIGQPLAIHAGKRKPTVGEVVGDWTVTRGTSGDWNMRPYPARAAARGGLYVPLPLGAVVATAVVADVVPVIDGSDAQDADLDDLPYPRIESYLGDDEFPNGSLSIYSPSEHGNPIDPIDGHYDATEPMYADFSSGRWAWLLSDAKPTERRCPKCWGSGECHPTRFCNDLCDDEGWCESCSGARECEPIPARGHSGLWNWEPT